MKHTLLALILSAMTIGSAQALTPGNVSPAWGCALDVELSGEKAGWDIGNGLTFPVYFGYQLSGLGVLTCSNGLGGYFEAPVLATVAAKGVGLGRTYVTSARLFSANIGLAASTGNHPNAEQLTGVYKLGIASSVTPLVGEVGSSIGFTAINNRRFNGLAFDLTLSLAHARGFGADLVGRSLVIQVLK